MTNELWTNAGLMMYEAEILKGTFSVDTVIRRVTGR
jgi:hypothetical protein